MTTTLLIYGEASKYGVRNQRENIVIVKIYYFYGWSDAFFCLFVISFHLYDNKDMFYYLIESVISL
jgi:hypothetical protein